MDEMFDKLERIVFEWLTLRLIGIVEVAKAVKVCWCYDKVISLMVSKSSFENLISDLTVNKLIFKLILGFLVGIILHDFILQIV